MLRLSFLQAVLDGLAVFRLTHLIMLDAITAPARDWLVGSTYDGQPRYPDGTRIPVAKRARVAVFLGCPWCISIWAAGGMVLLQTFAPAVCLYVSAVLAFSAVAGILAERV